MLIISSKHVLCDFPQRPVIWSHAFGLHAVCSPENFPSVIYWKVSACARIRDVCCSRSQAHLVDSLGQAGSTGNEPMPDYPLTVPRQPPQGGCSNSHGRQSIMCLSMFVSPSRCAYHVMHSKRNAYVSMCVKPGADLRILAAQTCIACVFAHLLRSLTKCNRVNVNIFESIIHDGDNSSNPQPLIQRPHQTKTIRVWGRIKLCWWEAKRTPTIFLTLINILYPLTHREAASGSGHEESEAGVGKTGLRSCRQWYLYKLYIVCRRISYLTLRFAHSLRPGQTNDSSAKPSDAVRFACGCAFGVKSSVCDNTHI